MSELNLVTLFTPGKHVMVLGLSALLLGGCAQMQQQMQQPGYYNLPAASSTTDALAQAEGSYATQAIRAPNQIQFDLRQPVTQNPNSTAPNTTAITTPAVKSTTGATSMPVQPIANTGSGNTAGNTAGNASQAAKPYDASGAPADLPPPDLSSAQNVSAANTNPGSSIQERLIPEPQTFSGTLPCFHPEMKCSAQRITLSLAPNGRWRARAAYLDQSAQNGSVQVDQGCWRGNMMSPPRVILLNTQGDARAELAMSSNNSLRLVSMNGESPNLTYTLTRQPDLDVISELDKKPAPNCP